MKLSNKNEIHISLDESEARIVYDYLVACNNDYDFTEETDKDVILTLTDRLEWCLLGKP